MNESVFLGGHAVPGFALGEPDSLSDRAGRAVGFGLTGALVGGAVGVASVAMGVVGHDYIRVPLTFAGVGAVGGAILGLL